MTTRRFKHQTIGTEFIQHHWDAPTDGCLIACETGVGKSLMILDFLVKYRDKKVLIVCPAIVRKEWERQNTLHLEQPLALVTADTGKQVEKWCQQNQSGCLVTSYNLLKSVIGEFDILIVDECHYISNPDAQMTLELERVVNASERTFLVSLSATPASDRPDQLWSILRLLEPGRWGETIWSFRRRYCNEIPNQWAPSGIEYKGLKQSAAGDLQRRLARTTYRVRKTDIASALPKLLPALRYIKPKRSKLSWDVETDFSELVGLNSSQKLDETCDIVRAGRESGESKFVCFTYLKQTAYALGERLRALDFATEVVTGDTKADDRHALIERSRSSSKPAVLVCNIDAVGIGLDFTFATTAVFAELHWNPGKTSQAIGRLIRLSSVHPCLCYFVVCEGSREQRQAEALARKFKDLDQLIAAGRDEAAITETFTSGEQSDDSVLAELKLL